MAKGGAVGLVLSPGWARSGRVGVHDTTGLRLIVALRRAGLEARPLLPGAVAWTMRLTAAALVAGLAISPARAAQWDRTPYGGVRVAAFDRRETRRMFGVAGTAIVAFDGYASDVEAVFVLTTRRGPCVDSGKLDQSGPLPVVRLRGNCYRITGLLLSGTE